MKFALALFALTSFAITGLALGSGAREASLERTERQILEQIDTQLAHKLALLKQ